MSANEELNSIKKKYGESFMHLCRKLFPTILEDDGVLSSILADYFAPNSRELGQIITKKHLESKFKEFIYSKLNSKNERVDKKETIDKDPYELLSEVGYQLFECHNEEEIQVFKKYYEPKEVLCTFREGGRAERNFVFFAVRKGAEKLKRKDFKKPQREDAYSTSVLGIQFPKEKRTTVQIISRYNHTVENPNATYGNDLDRIVPGLADSFGRLIASRGYYYSDENVEKFNVPNHIVGPDKRFYKYNSEINGIYFCPGNYVINGSKIHKYGRDKAIVMDDYILDLHQKKLLNMDDEDWYRAIIDCFPREFEEDVETVDENGKREVKTESTIAKLTVSKNFQNKNNRIVNIWLKGKEDDEPVTIELNKDNQIVGYRNKYLTDIGNSFMENNTTLEWLDLPNVTSISDKCLAKNNSLKAISLPKVTHIGSDFLSSNEVLEEINVPELKSVANDFLAANKALRTASFKKLEIIGDRFLMNNRELHSIDLPRVVRIGNYAFTYNKMISEISCPNVQQIGMGFMENNELLHRIYMPQLTKVGTSFCINNTQMEEIDFPSLLIIGSHFFAENEIIKRINLPKARKLGDCFLQKNLYAEKINLPEAKEIRALFMCSNVIATEVNMPKVESIQQGFMLSNTCMKIVNMQIVRSIEDRFLPEAKDIEVMNMSKLREASPELLFRVAALKRSNLRKIVNSLFNRELSSKDLAELDKETGLSRSDISNSKSLFQRIKDKFGFQIR